MVQTLTSDDNYNKLEKRFIDKGSVTQCEIFKQELGNQLANNTKFLSFCKIITGALEYYNVMRPLHLLEIDKCVYFNLWICEHLIKILGNFKHPKFDQIKTKIMDFWNQHNLEKTCKANFISYIGDPNYTKIKELYEYALNYESLKKYFDVGERSCSGKDREYIEKSLKLYEQVKHECELETESLLCNALKKVREEYKEDKLSKLSCNGTIDLEKIKSEVQQSLADRESLSQPQVTSFQTRADEVTVGDFSTTQLPNADGGVKFSGYNKAMSISFPMLGILFTFFVLYKFTPVGSWLYNRLLKRKAIDLNIKEEENNELFENTFYPINEKTNSNLHHLGYNPV
ncbi:PIR Superfamily Protein [Plasmodium ovale wallikeri]|uniref:PIR Superfamily Protein n=1 Tax=Plasmodium ovale wallikeri TaxID=864142 RepID=A0A1A9AFZ5_PLAOA|nr:PIR Superfamily Protein [Plasmodium ovale wallikeri]SBT56285.1 PIR Superfamily Protein [Plasmodium ovale wallikeri]